MTALTQEFYQVAFSPVPPLLRGLALRPLTVLEFTEAAEMLLAKARTHDCAYWLLDGRADRARQQPALYHWIEDDYLPRVCAALGRPPVIAFWAEPAMWQQLLAQGTPAPAATPLSGAFRIGWFTEESQAQAWIDQFRTLDS